MTACEKEQILLATSPNHADVQDWMNSMKDQLGHGYGTLGKNYAVTTPSQDPRNRLWDLLGAGGVLAAGAMPKRLKRQGCGENLKTGSASEAARRDADNGPPPGGGAGGGGMRRGRPAVRRRCPTTGRGGRPTRACRPWSRNGRIVELQLQIVVEHKGHGDQAVPTSFDSSSFGTYAILRLLSIPPGQAYRGPDRRARRSRRLSGLRQSGRIPSCPTPPR